MTGADRRRWLALGLPILASLAASRTDSLATSGDGPLVALNGGYHAAFLAGAVFVVAAVVIPTALLRAASAATSHSESPRPVSGLAAATEGGRD